LEEEKKKTRKDGIFLKAQSSKPEKMIDCIRNQRIPKSPGLWACPTIYKWSGDLSAGLPSFPVAVMAESSQLQLRDSGGLSPHFL
jgi:hypothetical protein